MLGMDTTTATIEDFSLFMIFGVPVANGYMKFQNEQPADIIIRGS
jgi:hypothetical protein